MKNLSNMIWVELRKAVSSRIPLWTAIASLVMPLGIAFLIWASKNPEIVQKLGLIGAKANLIAYAGTDWHTYLGLYGQLMAAGGFFLFVMSISWVFGREFADGTVKDLLAVPVQRSSILLAKFIVVGIWSAALAVIIYIAGMLMGVIIQLPGGSTEIILQGSLLVLATTGMVLAVILPFALVASIGRGYLLPVGVAVVTIMLANLVVVAGWGDFFPWAVPMLYTQAMQEGVLLGSASYWVVIITGLVGMFATYLWWKLADQNR